MRSNQHHEHYFEAGGPENRSPGTLRHPAQSQTLHRISSRHFEAPSPMNGLYSADEGTLRYDSPRFDRQAATLHGGYGGYDMPSTGTWNPGAFGASPHLTNFGTTARMRPPTRRPPLPTPWIDTTASVLHEGPPQRFPPPMQQNHRQDQPGGSAEDELIPTAIVIKNIPFAVKKEQLTSVMTDLNLPLPYAFNYHFDCGVFRGLAFANFTSADETRQVIETLNQFELQGRKLRVEYKKMLPVMERERIEREKRERRGQLEEQHRPLGPTPLQNQTSMSSIASHYPAASPSPVSTREAKPEINLNDPQTLQYYSQLLLFKDDPRSENLVFPSTLSPTWRRTVHTIAHMLGLAHVSRGNGDQRQVHVFRAHQPDGVSPPIPSFSHGDTIRRGLNKAATTDFASTRDPFAQLGRQGSYLDIPGSPGAGNYGNTAQNLRAAKSHADLRSFSPSPAPSSASFPNSLREAIPKYGEQEQGNMPNSTNMGPGNGMGGGSAESHLANGFNQMSLGTGLGLTSTGSRDFRGNMSSERELQQSFGGPIGSNRGLSTNYDDQSRDRSQGLPMRQPRGPLGEATSGFSRGRQNGHQHRRSDDYDAHGNELDA